MTLPDPGNGGSADDGARNEVVTRPLSPARRRAGSALTAVAVVAQLVWLTWRVATLPLHPVGVTILAIELAGLIGALVITVGLARARQPRDYFLGDPRESRRFAFAVADIVGRTRSEDLQIEVLRAARTVTRRRLPPSAEAAVTAVVIEGPRRLLLVVTLTVALLLGDAPMSAPPLYALAALAVGTAGISVGHVVLGDGRIRFGDRTRWSYSSIGEILVSRDLDGVAPRRWVGTVATVAVVSLAVGLRGMSDRWTHGLAPMNDEARTVTMLLAIVTVVGALFTLRTIQAPAITDDHLRSRRLEERTARQSALGATVLVGLVGLLAGVLPGGVDAADRDPVRVEQTVDPDIGIPRD